MLKALCTPPALRVRSRAVVSISSISRAGCSHAEDAEVRHAMHGAEVGRLSMGLSCFHTALARGQAGNSAALRRGDGAGRARETPSQRTPWCHRSGALLAAGQAFGVEGEGRGRGIFLV